MKNKVITITLSIILFLVPVLMVPNSSKYYNSIKFIVLLGSGIVLLVGLLIKWIQERKIKFDICDILAFVFGILAIISTIFSLNPAQSIIGAPNRYEGLLVILIYILVYYTAKYYFKTYKNFIDIGIIVYMAICILAIIQFYFPADIQILPLFGRGANGTFGNTNFMGSFISIILPIFIGSYIFTKKKKYLVSSILSFCVLIMCLARSSWVGFAVYAFMLILYLIIKKNKDYWKRFLILFIAFIISFTAIYCSNRGKELVLNRLNLVGTEIVKMTKQGVSKEMGASRIEIWIMTLDVIYKKPIVGCGIDALQYGLRSMSPERNTEYIVSHGNYVDKAHNEYLHIAATMGIPAMIIYLSFALIIVLGNLKKIKNKKIAVLLFTVIMSYLAQAFFNISTISIAPIFWFILGFASKNTHLKKHVIKVK